MFLFFNFFVNFVCLIYFRWDETLYRAWSTIVESLIPNIGILQGKLCSLCDLCGADEVVLFEKTTFLVISHSIASSDETSSRLVSDSTFIGDDQEKVGTSISESPSAVVTQISSSSASSSITFPISKRKRDAHRFEKVSNIIKQFKLSCHASQGNFQSLEIRNSTFSAFVDQFTESTYIMIIVINPDVIQPAAISININAARPYFEKLLS